MNKCHIKSLSASFTKRSNALKQFLGKLPTNCFSVFDHFMGLALKGLSKYSLDIEEFYSKAYTKFFFQK